MSCPETRTARRARIIGAALLLAAASWSGAALAQSMVVRSTGPSAAKYPVGKKFAANEQVTLVAGDQLILIDQGKTRTLARPGTHKASAGVEANQTLTSTVTRMIARDGAMRSRGGFTRGPGETGNSSAEVRAPNLWLIDARQGGNFCVADPARLLVWRPDMTGDALLRIASGSEADKTETLAFVDGQAYRRWPSETIAAVAGARYHLSGWGSGEPVSIRFELLDALPETPDAIAELLLAKGCTGQLDRLVSAMAEDEAPGR
jgi:hypothetical protein